MTVSGDATEQCTGLAEGKVPGGGRSTLVKRAKQEGRSAQWYGAEVELRR